MRKTIIIFGSIVVFGILPIAVFFTDFTALFSPLTPLWKTDEKELVLRNGVMHAKDGKLFSGTSVYKGYIETYPKVETGWFMTGERDSTIAGKTVTDYKNGRMDGVQRRYYTYRNSLLGMLGGPDFRRTILHSQTDYKNGKKNGKEIINFDIESEMRLIEAHYADDKLNGVYKEYHFIDPYIVGLKNTARNIGPLKLEVEYKNGEIDGCYRTYNQYGDTCENYVQRNNRVLEGRRMIYTEDNERKWQWFHNGLLTVERVFDNSTYGESKEPPLADNTLGGTLISETFYEKGESGN